MAIDLDRHLGILPEALALRARRAELIATNLANADTPNFKARDFDFREVLAAQTGRGSGVALATTQPGHVGSAAPADPGTGLKYRVPLAPSLDGNTVDAQLEQSAFAENSVRYQATLTFLSARFRSLMTAISGQ